MNTGRVSWLTHNTLYEGQIWAAAEIGFMWVIDDARNMHKVRNYKLIPVGVAPNEPTVQLTLDLESVSA